MTQKVRCNMCEWEGEEEDLKQFVEFDDGLDVRYINGCPKCKTDEYLMDIEGGELDGSNSSDRGNRRCG